MSTFSVAADVRKVRASLDAIAQRQVPFATAKAINQTLEQIQRAELAQIGRAFTVRRPDFAKRTVKIGRADFATKKNPVGRISIDGPGADIYAKFEQGGTKTPRAGSALAVPITGSLVKRGPRSIVPDHMRPKALAQSLSVRVFERAYKNDPAKRGLFAVDRLAEEQARAERLRAQGGYRTVQGRDAKGRFLGAFGPLPQVKIGKRLAKRGKPKLLYALDQAAPITRRLEFIDTAGAVIRSGFVPNLRAEIARALANPKGTARAA